MVKSCDRDFAGSTERARRNRLALRDGDLSA